MWHLWLSHQLHLTFSNPKMGLFLAFTHLFCHLRLCQCLRVVCWTRRAAWGERRGEEERAEGEESPWRGMRARSLSWGCSSRGSCRGTGPASHRSRSRLWRKVRPCKHAQLSPAFQPIAALHGRKPEQSVSWRSLCCCFFPLPTPLLLDYCVYTLLQLFGKYQGT